MVHNYISSKSIIERVYNDYNIQSDDFVSRLSTWTLNAIREIGIKQTYILSNIILTLSQYKACIPKEIDRIYGVKINGFTADLSYDLCVIDKVHYNQSEVIGFDGKIYNTEPNLLESYDGVSPVNTPTVDTFNNLYVNTEINPDPLYDAQFDGLAHSVFDINYWKLRTNKTYKYKIVNGWINSDVDEGTLEVACGMIPYTYDAELEIVFPLIPDDENLIKAITFYVLGQMLMRGYKHPLLSYSTNNEFLNPGLGWTKYSKLARNSCNSISPDSKRTLTKLTGRNII